MLRLRSVRSILQHGVALLALMACPALARAEPGAEPAPYADPNSQWGGTTLRNQQFIWIRPALGYDMFTELISTEVGYARALSPEIDAGLAIAGNLGFATAVGATLRLKWSAFHYRNFHVAAELPFSNAIYPDGEAPHLRMIGVEPGVTMSNVFDPSFGIFYGPALRFYYAASTYYVGPQLRVGGGFAFKELRLALAINVSHMAVTYTPEMTLFSLDLTFGYQF